MNKLRIANNLFILLTFFLVKPGESTSCTAFRLKINDQILVGKNLDWPVGDGFVIINKKGVTKYALVDQNEQPATWTAKYGSVTFNQFGLEFPLGGMNEAGLVVEELSYSPSVYPASDSLPHISELQWIQYQLDNFSSVQEVIANLYTVKIHKFLFGIHYFITDRHGESAVIEFIEGNIISYSGKDLVIPVLSNNRYQNSLKYLKMHQGFGGEMIVRDGPGSQERFVRAAMMLKDYHQDDKRTPTDYGFAILNQVRQIDTQWQIIYNPVDLTIVYKTSKEPDAKHLELSGIDFSKNKRSEFFKLGKKCLSKDLRSCFSAISIDRNQALLQNVFKQLVELGEIENQTAIEIITRFREYHQLLSR